MFSHGTLGILRSCVGPRAPVEAIDLLVRLRASLKSVMHLTGAASLFRITTAIPATSARSITIGQTRPDPMLSRNLDPLRYVSRLAATPSISYSASFWWQTKPAKKTRGGAPVGVEALQQ